MGSALCIWGVVAGASALAVGPGWQRGWECPDDGREPSLLALLGDDIFREGRKNNLSSEFRASAAFAEGCRVSVYARWEEDGRLCVDGLARVYVHGPSSMKSSASITINQVRTSVNPNALTQTMTGPCRSHSPVSQPKAPAPDPDSRSRIRGI